jgi:thiol-disulfide isomerase/thioredoxin
MKSIFVVLLFIGLVSSSSDVANDSSQGVEEEQIFSFEDHVDDTLEDSELPMIMFDEDVPTTPSEGEEKDEVVEAVVTESGEEEEILVTGFVEEEVAALNLTSEGDANKTSPTPYHRRVTCLTTNRTKEEEEPVVTVLNGTTFLHVLNGQHNSNVTNRTTPAQCSFGLFYASWCPFSAKAAPHFNGLARLFPDVKMLAVDTGMYHGINTQFGIIALPTLVLFHNSKPVAKYNLTELEVEPFIKYLNLFTGLEPYGPVALKDADYEGPVPTTAVPGTNYYIYIAWIFTILCAIFFFGKSSYCRRMIEAIRNTWREAEMHEHQE